MKTALKIVGICVFTIFILCLNVNGKPLFGPIYAVLSHITIPFQNTTGSILTSVFDSAQEYSRKLFDNSTPKVKDAVKARVAAPARGSGEPAEVILVDEKEELDELIKSHH